MMRGAIVSSQMRARISRGRWRNLGKVVGAYLEGRGLRRICGVLLGGLRGGWEEDEADVRFGRG